MFYYSAKKEHDTYQSETPYLTNHRHSKKLYKNTGSQMSFSGKQNILHPDTINTLCNNNGIFNPSLLNYSYVNILHIYQHHKNKQKCFTIVSKKNTTLIKVRHLITKITGTTKNFTKTQVLR